MVYAYIVRIWQRSCWFLVPVWLVMGGISLCSVPLPLPPYTQALTPGPDTEWRFAPLVVDINGDGYPDLVPTARLADPALHLGQVMDTPSPRSSPPGRISATPPWPPATSTTTASPISWRSATSAASRPSSAMASGAIETIMWHQDGYVAAQLADVNGDGELDLILRGVVLGH